MTANAGDRWAWAVKFVQSAAGVDGRQQDERWVKLIWVAPAATVPYSQASFTLSRILMNFYLNRCCEPLLPPTSSSCRCRPSDCNWGRRRERPI